MGGRRDTYDVSESYEECTVEDRSLKRYVHSLFIMILVSTFLPSLDSELVTHDDTTRGQHQCPHCSHKASIPLPRRTRPSSQLTIIRRPASKVARLELHTVPPEQERIKDGSDTLATEQEGSHESP
jgi:hypothetical protein